MSQPGWTWLDRLAGGLGMIGISMLSALAILGPSMNFQAKSFNLCIGGIAVVEAIIYLLWRGAATRARDRDSSVTFDPRHVPVAVNMILGALAIVASFMFLAIGAINKPHLVLVWGAATFAGCIAGGGLIAHGWNGYRQIEGANDLIEEQLGWTLVDWSVLTFGLIGVVGALSGLVLSFWLTWETVFLTVLVGVIMSLQAALFVVMRTLLRRAAGQESATDEIGS